MSQSGGKKGKSFQISRQGNPALRYIVTLIGRNLCCKKCNNDYFIEYYERMIQRGKVPSQVYAAAGNKFLRTAFAMLKSHRLFHIPGYEQCTCSIIGKFSNKDNKEAAKKAVAMLTDTSSEKTAVAL